jgi:NADH:ubiquinone reductase (non-electrogenic)
MDAKKNLVTIPYGLMVWATGNMPRAVVSELIKKLPDNVQNQRRGIVVDDNLKVKGCDGIYALGDATATRWAPTAQVASGQGRCILNLT